MDQVPRQRILMIAFCCDPQGTMEERNGWQRAIMAAQRFDVTVLYCPKNLPVDLQRSIPDELIHHVRFLQIRLQGWSQWMLDREQLFYFGYRLWHHRAYQEAKQLHAQSAFDLTHLVTLCGYREPGKLWQMDVPHLWGPIGGSHNYPSRMYGVLNLKGKLWEIFRTWVNHFQLHHSHRIRQAARQSIVLAATKNSALELESSFGIQTHVDLETGIDYEIRPLRQARNASHPLRILWTGRLRAWKALPLLLKALAKLSPSIQYELRVIGDGDCLGSWQRLARDLGVAERIQWLPWPNYRETLPEYEWAELFVFTSLRDTSGTGLVESLAAGCPLIAVDHQGVADMLEHDCGYPVDVGTLESAVEGIRAAIVSSANDSITWLRKSHAATRYAEKLHWANRGERMLELYDQALTRKEISQERVPDEHRNRISSRSMHWKGFLAIADQGVVSFTNFVTIWLLANNCDNAVFAAIALAAQFINYSRSALERLLSATYAAFIHHPEVNQSTLTGSSLTHAAAFTSLVTGVAVIGALIYGAVGTSSALALGLLSQCLLLPFQMLRDHLRSLSLSRFKVLTVFAFDAVSSAVQLSLLLALIQVGRTDSLSLSIAWAFANVLFIGLWLAKRPFPYQIVAEQVRLHWAEGWAYSKWLVLGRLLGIASYLFVPWILTAIQGEQQWTLFAKAINLVGLSVMVVMGSNSFLQPLAIHAYHDGGPAALKRIMKLSLIAFAVLHLALCSLYFTVGGTLMEWLYKTNDPRQGWIVTMLGLNVLAFSVAVVASNGLAAFKQSRASFWGEAANFAVSACVAAPLIIWQGSLGAALAITLGSLAAAVVTISMVAGRLSEH